MQFAKQAPRNAFQWSHWNRKHKHVWGSMRGLYDLGGKENEACNNTAMRETLLTCSGFASIVIGELRGTMVLAGHVHTVLTAILFAWLPHNLTPSNKLRNSDGWRGIFWRLFLTRSVMGRFWDDHFRDLGYPPKFYKGQDAGFDNCSSS